MDIRELIESTDVVDFFSQYTELEQRGREWWGLTPFQEENTPSFSVDPDRKVFYCFSTGKGGDVIDFLKDYYKCSTSDAIKKFEEYCGVDETDVKRRKRLVATSICKKFKKRESHTKNSTAKILPDNCMDKYIENEHLDVWMNEGISKDVLDMYQVRYDPLADRLVYPIRNLDGNVVNIGGRILDPNWKDKGLRKYTYYQGWGTIDVIFGLYENKTGILSSRNLTIFEGAKSVMLANTWGIRDCGAILTSHLSVNQTRILLTLCTRHNLSVTFALDKEIDVMNDKHIMMLKKYINVYSIFDKDGLLPDPKMAPVDMGEEVFRKLLSQRYHL